MTYVEALVATILGGVLLFVVGWYIYCLRMLVDDIRHKRKFLRYANEPHSSLFVVANLTIVTLLVSWGVYILTN